MSSDDVLIAIAVIIGPTSIVLIAGIVKGYRLTLRLDRPERKRWWHNGAIPSNLGNMDNLGTWKHRGDDSNGPPETANGDSS